MFWFYVFLFVFAYVIGKFLDDVLRFIYEHPKFCCWCVIVFIAYVILVQIHAWVTDFFAPPPPPPPPVEDTWWSIGYLPLPGM